MAQIDSQLIKKYKIGIIGYGSQGQAQAHNLNDSGCNVTIVLRDNSSKIEIAKKDGFNIENLQNAAKNLDILVFLAPDEEHAGIYKNIEPYLKKNSCLIFAHGFAINFGQINPRSDLDIVMVAPKGIGPMVRRLYVQGSGVAALVGVHQNASKMAEKIALSYADALGCSRIGILEASFKNECETDLFSEQVILCGGLTELVRQGFDTLVEAGYPQELAYFECLHEVKLIADIMYEQGISSMFKKISNTAEFGAYVSGKRIINEDVKAKMKEILCEIQDGTFAKNWIDEFNSGKLMMQKQRLKDEQHSIEKIGKTIRDMIKIGGKNA